MRCQLSAWLFWLALFGSLQDGFAKLPTDPIPSKPVRNRQSSLLTAGNYLFKQVVKALFALLRRQRIELSYHCIAIAWKLQPFDYLARQFEAAFKQMSNAYLGNSSPFSHYWRFVTYKTIATDNRAIVRHFFRRPAFIDTLPHHIGGSFQTRSIEYVTLNGVEAMGITVGSIPSIAQ